MSDGLREDLARVIFTAEQIENRVAELAQAISADYGDKRPLVVGVLNGCFPLMADLLRRIPVLLEVDFIAVSSYGGLTESSGVVRVVKDLTAQIHGRHVLLVEDIVDTGLTLRFLLDSLAPRRPASLQVCALLDKHDARVEPVVIAYRGFTCPNEFVVGYGLDYGGFYRNLPCIGVLRPELTASGRQP